MCSGFPWTRHAAILRRAFSQISCTVEREISICAAHCSWVCYSRSTSRMTSYSSSVSRIGSVFSHPLGQNVSTCGTPQIWRHRGGLGMGAFLPLYSLYSDCSTLSRKKQFFQKLLYFPSSYVCQLIFGVECYMWALFVMPTDHDRSGSHSIHMKAFPVMLEFS